MSTADLYADLIRRAEACEQLRDDNSGEHRARCAGKAAAYRHAAELLRGAVAAAVEEEREGCADLCDARARGDRTAAGRGAWERAADAIRARGESPRGEAASDGREGAE